MNVMTSHSPRATVRVAGDADVSALAELRARWVSGSGPEPAFHRRMAAWMTGEGERRTTWLAVAADRPVGMVSLFEYRRMPRPGREDSAWGYVGNLFVQENSRNRGVGSALLSEVVATAEERSYARLTVSPSPGALSLFRRAGFVVPGKTAGAEAVLVRPGARRCGRPGDA